jgi:hypothetical protein
LSASIFDGAMHATDNRHDDMAHLPLDWLVNRGAVVDIAEASARLKACPCRIG